MATSVPRISATIHQFPVNPETRVRLLSRRAEAVARPVIDDGGWYHQEAVEEAATHRDPVESGRPH